MSGRASVDEQAASRFLGDRFGEPAESVRFLGQGEWSVCFSFRQDGSENVIRFGNHLEDFEKDRRAGSYAHRLFPVPTVSEIGQAFGGHYAISQRVFGAPMNELSPDGWRVILPELFAALDQASRVDVSSTTGFGMWDAHGNAPYKSWREFVLAAGDDVSDRRTHGWRKSLDDSPTGNGPFLEALQALEQQVAGCEDVGRSLVHADLLQNNVLVDHGTITGILDWGCSLYGDFIYDHAWLAFWAPWFSAAREIDFAAETTAHFEARGYRADDIERRMRCCQIHIGLDAQAYNAFTGRWSDLAHVAARTVTPAREAS